MSSFDDLMSANEQCAFDAIFGEPRPSVSGSNSLKYTSSAEASGRTGSDGIKPVSGLQIRAPHSRGTFTTSAGELVNFEVHEPAAGMFVASSEASRARGRSGWARSARSAIDDLKELTEAGFYDHVTKPR